jgi:hypothetical protein
MDRQAPSPGGADGQTSNCTTGRKPGSRSCGELLGSGRYRELVGLLVAGDPQIRCHGDEVWLAPDRSRNVVSLELSSRLGRGCWCGHQPDQLRELPRAWSTGSVTLSWLRLLAHPVRYRQGRLLLDDRACLGLCAVEGVETELNQIELRWPSWYEQLATLEQTVATMAA